MNLLVSLESTRIATVVDKAKPSNPEFATAFNSPNLYKFVCIIDMFIHEFNPSIQLIKS